MTNLTWAKYTSLKQLWLRIEWVYWFTLNAMLPWITSFKVDGLWEQAGGFQKQQGHFIAIGKENKYWTSKNIKEEQWEKKEGREGKGKWEKQSRGTGPCAGSCVCQSWALATHPRRGLVQDKWASEQGAGPRATCTPCLPSKVRSGELRLLKNEQVGGKRPHEATKVLLKYT